MSFIWFLLSVLIAAFFYFRLSKRIANLNLELSNELKTEIISLIAEFNRSAENNITLIEERVGMAKEISKDIAEQMVYMKKLKETIEKEIKEAEIRLKTMVKNEQSVVNANNLRKTVIANTYEEITKKTLPVQGQKKEQEQKNALAIEKKTEKQESKTLISSEETSKSVKEQAIELQKQGLILDEIAQKLKISRGEVELYLKFGRMQNLSS